ncbi:MAG: competence/damage-inducible protein A [candidate division KSB1 bacterium]|nr:competence/damage-inducible protein A [candidate division KSB1 bacterium]MDZ7302814.1 competence/damage-inducible protein A [candidate division KSB1 bacterium]MDZ7311831.1 competence/damage-inducible protein A [candidate division KSB1 bacterium]
MTAEIITIGDELLIGQIVNTNAAWMSRELNLIDVPVRFVSVVGDNAEDIRRSLDLALSRTEVVLLSGGLGPTHDDITKKVVAEYFDSADMVLDEKVLTHVKALLQRRNIRVKPANEAQALVPKKATVLWNDYGTAPGLLFQRNGRYCIVMPGVPAEMQHIMRERVLPFLKTRIHNAAVRHRTIRTFGVPESALFEKLSPVADLEQFGRVAFLPRFSGVDVRISVHASSAAEAEERIGAAEAIVISRAGEHVYGFDEDVMEAVIGRLLMEKNATLAVAESCTGGLLAHRFTNIPGSSQYFDRGIVAYSNSAKMQLLGVSEEILHQHGAVSEQCAIALAAGVRRLSGTTYGLATTGIAGPTGGSEEKPVGLVWVGVATPSLAFAQKAVFTGDRQANKERFSQLALNLLYQELRK